MHRTGFIRFLKPPGPFGRARASARAYPTAVVTVSSGAPTSRGGMPCREDLELLVCDSVFRPGSCVPAYGWPGALLGGKFWHDHRYLCNQANDTWLFQFKKQETARGIMQRVTQDCGLQYYERARSVLTATFSWGHLLPCSVARCEKIGIRSLHGSRVCGHSARPCRQWTCTVFYCCGTSTQGSRRPTSLAPSQSVGARIGLSCGSLCRAIHQGHRGQVWRSTSASGPIVWPQPETEHAPLAACQDHLTRAVRVHVRVEGDHLESPRSLQRRYGPAAIGQARALCCPGAEAVCELDGRLLELGWVLPRRQPDGCRLRGRSCSQRGMLCPTGGHLVI